MDVNLWDSAEHALEYLTRVDTIPHRTEGEAALLECLPNTLSRLLDIGSGDGRRLALVAARPTRHWKWALPDAAADRTHSFAAMFVSHVTGRTPPSRSAIANC